MNIRKFINVSLMAVALTGFVACSDDEPKPNLPNPDVPKVSEGVYVLNQGQYYNGIEGSLNVIDYKSTNSVLNVFKTVNGRSLGGTPQCGVAYGSKIYLGIHDSNTIEIINRSDYKSYKQISLDATTGNQPRSVVATGGKVYFSMYDGYVARLDTISMTIDAKVKVGANPEIMALHNGKLYVPNSEGMNYPAKPYGKTASVVELSSFSVTETFEVPENPAQFYAADNEVYLLCKGNYGDVASCLYKVNTDRTVEKIDDATLAEVCGNEICYVNDPFYGSGIAEYKKYDLKTRRISDWNIERPEYAATLFYDRLADRIVISSLKYYGGQYPSFELPGYVAVYDRNGKLLRNYDAGVGPACIFSNAE